VLVVFTSRLVVCAAIAGTASWFLLQPRVGAQSTPTPGPSREAPAANQRPDLPSWAYVPAPRRPRTPDDGSVRHVPGSTKGYTLAQINDHYNAPDWFPDEHPPAPRVVLHGREPAHQACGECHLANGRGKPDTAGLNGLPAAYIVQQLADFKAGRRHAAVPQMAASSMMAIAAVVTPDDAQAAADYFSSVAPAKWIRVVESETAPKTEPAGHRFFEVPGGGVEPLGDRIVELPENEGLTQLRDPKSGFVAYVPVGSLRRGERLVKLGGNGRTIACTTCHGMDLRGLGAMVPPIAGRSPSYLARQIYDIKAGARDGANTPLMRGPVANLTDRDIVDITAYLASLPQ
jgi:cytochrome c553